METPQMDTSRTDADSTISKEDRIQNISDSLKHLKDVLFSMRERDMQIYEKLMGVESSIWRLKYSAQLEGDIGSPGTSPKHQILHTSISEEASYIFDDEDSINDEFHNGDLRSLMRVQSEPSDHFNIGLDTPPSCLARLSVCKTNDKSSLYTSPCSSTSSPFSSTTSPSTSSNESPSFISSIDRAMSLHKEELQNERFLTILRIRSGSSDERDIRREIFI